VTDRNGSGPEKSKDWELGEATSPSLPPCAFCFHQVDLANRWVCPKCHAVYHVDCWKTNEGRCAVYGCGSRDSRKAIHSNSAPAALMVGVVVAVVIVLGALVVAVSRPAMRRSTTTACMNNLSQLWKMQSVYASHFGGPMKLMSDQTGKEFWRALCTTQPPLIDPTVSDIFLCPVKGDSPEGGNDYRGPVRAVRHLNDSDPVGGDEPGNHDAGEGGNVLRKSGDVLEIREPEWSALAGLLKP
jgi:hypothetical protein